MHLNVLTLLAIGFISPVIEAAIYQDTKHKFQFEYDEAHWEITAPRPVASAGLDDDIKKRTLVVLQSKHEEGKYRSRFSVVLDALDTALDPLSGLTYQNRLVSFLKSQRFQNIHKGSIRSDSAGQSFELISDQRDFGLTFKQVGFVQSKRVLLLTLSTRIASFENTRVKNNSFFESFRFEPPMDAISSH